MTRGRGEFSPPTLEIAAGNAGDAVLAVASGADRVELNAALGLGGLTPTPGAVALARGSCDVPLIAMLRPRSGGFAYDRAERLVMRRDLDTLLAAGADGVAVGVLDEVGAVDVSFAAELVRASGGRALVFHRAFDRVADPFEALKQLIDLGFVRVMTSGQAASAPAGAARIAALVEQAAGRIEVLPAGGIRPEQVGALIAATGCDQIHASARVRRVDPSGLNRPEVRFLAGPRDPDPEAEASYDAVDPAVVAAFRAALDGQVVDPGRGHF